MIGKYVLAPFQATKKDGKSGAFNLPEFLGDFDELEPLTLELIDALAKGPLMMNSWTSLEAPQKEPTKKSAEKSEEKPKKEKQASKEKKEKATEEKKPKASNQGRPKPSNQDKPRTPPRGKRNGKKKPE